MIYVLNKPMQEIAMAHPNYLTGNMLLNFQSYISDNSGRIITTTLDSHSYFIEDIDKDGLIDSYEIKNGTDPLVSKMEVSDYYEGEASQRYRTWFTKATNNSVLFETVSGTKPGPMDNSSGYVINTIGLGQENQIAGWNYGTMDRTSSPYSSGQTHWF